MVNDILLYSKKRNEQMYQFYYMMFGQIIKKRRLELNLTQEYVAKSICSNTYISKTENNQVVMGDDQLFRIMERLNISVKQYAKPEKLVHFLEKVIDYFFYRDLENYRLLIEKIEDNDFQAVIEVIRLGYYVLNKEYDKAEKAYHLILDYLNSIDDLAFELFLFFSSQLFYKTYRLKLAKFLIESTYVIHQDYPELNMMYNYTKFVVYGKLHLNYKSSDLVPGLMMDLMKTGNIVLLNELTMYKALFSEYMDEKINIKYLDRLIETVDYEVVDEYLLVKGFGSDNPKEYIEKISKKNHDLYLIGLYLLARQSFSSEDKAVYNDLREEISKFHYQSKLKIDYNNLLTLEKKGDAMFFKDYLANSCLKEAKKHEHIYLMKKITYMITDILKSKARYKDALTYTENLQANIKKLCG